MSRTSCTPRECRQQFVVHGVPRERTPIPPVVDSRTTWLTDRVPRDRIRLDSGASLSIEHREEGFFGEQEKRCGDGNRQ